MNYIQILEKRLAIKLGEPNEQGVRPIVQGTPPNTDEEALAVIEQTHGDGSPGVIEFSRDTPFVDGQLHLRVNESGEYENQVARTPGLRDGILVTIDPATGTVTAS